MLVNRASCPEAPGSGRMATSRWSSALPRRYCIDGTISALASCLDWLSQSGSDRITTEKTSTVAIGRSLGKF
eukprot:6619091-Pyramimonas_sp.AAC.1